MNSARKPVFPCSALPDDPSECRLLGLYPQRQEGLWLQRIKLLGGMLSSRQWAALARISRLYTPLTSMRLTTRQDIELHNITTDNVPLLQSELKNIGLSGLGSCGDTLRNITVCPGSGLCKGEPDLTGVAMAVRHALEDFSGIYSLPRKFKISFSSCKKACAQPWINDLGFVADLQNGEVNIKVIGAGSLGARPATGIIIKEDLRVQDMPALAVAAVRLFNAHGDRKTRSKARLRHVRERLGDNRFLEILNKEFEERRNENLPAASSIAIQDKGYQYVAELNFPYGDIDPQHAEAIANLMQEGDIIARLQNHHRVSIFALNADLAFKAVNTDSHLSRLLSGPDIVSCPGSTYCKHALVNTQAVEAELRREIPESETRSIRISGCPNGCAHSAVADIGFTGRIQKDEKGNRVEGFHVFKGGGMGRTQALAENHTPFVPSGEVADLILKS